MTKPTSILLAAAASACCASLALAAPPEHHHGHHHAFEKDVDAFHSVLAPVWHARPGPERLRNACAKGSEMQALASAIRSADAARLGESVARLNARCAGKPPSGVDQALFDVHEAFHGLIEPKKPETAR